MAPTPIPAPLPPWAKAILQLTPFVAGFLEELLTHSGDMPDPHAWMRLQVTATNTATGAVSQDKQTCSFDLANITGGALDSSWITSDFTTCEALFDTFFTAYKAFMVPWLTITEYRWYLRSFNDYTTDKPFAEHGPPVRVQTRSLAGTGTTGNQAQGAATITERTAFPRHWGRLYLPTPDGGHIGAGGRLSSTFYSSVGTAAATLYGSLQTAQFFPVVPVTQVDKTPARALLTVDQIAIDDVADVIRRRRPRNVINRFVSP